jgi:HEAT repeat protein
VRLALHRSRPADATERLRRLDRGAGAAELLEAVRDPSAEVARHALGWLAHEGGPEERDALREIVWTCDPMLVMDVAGTLRALGDDATVDAAIGRLGVSATAERCRAARVLERFADRRAISALCAALSDEDGSVRGAALDALARLGHHSGAATTAAALVKDVDGEVRRRAVRAIGRLSRHPADAVRPAIGDPMPLVRREIARLAARLDRADVSQLLGDPDPQVRATAAANAGPLSKATLMSVLMSDPHPAVRLAAAQTLGMLGGPEAGAALIEAALDDDDAMVRARALRLAEETLSHPGLVARVRDRLLAGRGHRQPMTARALAKLSGRISEAEALRLAHDPDPGVRLALAQVAAAIVDPPEHVLSLLADDEDATVRHAAAVHRTAPLR